MGALGAAKRAVKGNSHCGDQFGHWQRGKRTILCVVDGLGHGRHAERAAKDAIAYVANHLSLPLPEIFSGCNTDIQRTRGVAMGIAIIDEDRHTLTYAGVGNTRIMIMQRADSELSEREAVYLKSNYGIVGGGYKNLLPETAPFKSGDMVIMYTDGVKEMIDLSGYGKLLHTDMERLAEKIIKDRGHETDDAAVLIFMSEV